MRVHARQVLGWARVLFVLVGVWFIWRGLDGRGAELRMGLAETPVWGLALSIVLVGLGLLATAELWRVILGVFGYHLPRVPAAAIFFVGQLGKYIPGSVWSFAAQAQGARRHDVPVRVTVNTSLVFLGFHVATGAVVGLGTLSFLDGTQVPLWASVGGAAGGLIALTPMVIAAVSRVVGGPDGQLRLGLRQEAKLLVPMAAAWTCYAASLVVLRPHAGWSTGVLIIAAYAVSYVAGVLVFLAPAGVGAREATFVLITEHALGVGSAAALALVTRVVMTIGDLGLAGLSTVADRRRRPL
jgi:uncharacterized membrane protein YbhN (UPF0104 family)